MTEAKEQKDIQLWVCQRCGHRWANRKPNKPKVCPKCKNYNWDEPKKLGVEQANAQTTKGCS